MLNNEVKKLIGNLFIKPIFRYSNMNKTELVAAVAEKGDLSKSDAGRAVDAVFNTITEALKNGDTITLVGFGSFTVKQRQERTGRNPKTGEELKIPATSVPSFKAGKSLKDAVTG